MIYLLLAILLIIILIIIGRNKQKKITKEEIKTDIIISNNTQKQTNSKSFNSNSTVKDKPTSNINNEYFKKDVSIEFDILFDTIDIDKEDVLYFEDFDNDEYKVLNLHHMTCSCNDFKQNRSQFSKYSNRRYCKHLLNFGREELKNLRPNSDNELIKYAGKDIKYFPSTGGIYIINIESNDILIIQNYNSGWFDIYTRKHKEIDNNKSTGEITRYGYNLQRNRWAYGEAPYKPLQIKDFLKTVKYKNIDNNLNESSFEKYLKNRNELTIDTFINSPNLQIYPSSIFYYFSNILETIEDLKIIERCLDKFQFINNLKKQDIVKEWLKYTQHLNSLNNINAKHFFNKAQELSDKKINLKINSNLKNSETEIISFVRTKEDRFNHIISKYQKKIDLVREKKIFDNLPISKRKNIVLDTLKIKAPDWYDINKKHTFWGYEYHNCLRKITNNIDYSNLDDKSLSIIQYVTSLIIIDGTVSERVISEILKVRGRVFEAKKDFVNALELYKDAEKLYDKIGVKRSINLLEKELNKNAI